MRHWLTRIFRFFLYSNFWIGAAAAGLCWQTTWIWQGTFGDFLLPAFVFCATVTLYATHRLVSAARLRSGQWQERFFYISRSSRWITANALVAAALTLYIFFRLSRPIQWSVVLPGLLSILYVVPVIRGGKRVRDIHFVKIFLIALVWAWVTVYLPARQLGLHLHDSFFLMFSERLCFIFAITLPFDVRDLLLDQAQSVKTLPAVMGIRPTRILGAGLLLLAFVFAFLNLHAAVYETGQFLGITGSYAVAYYLLHRATPDRPDYYFTGFLDGTMILQVILVFLLS